MNGGARPAGEPPAIARLGGWDRIAGTASGPINRTIGGAFTGAWNRTDEFARGAAVSGESEVASATAALVFTPHNGDLIETFGRFSNSNVPFARDPIQHTGCPVVGADHSRPGVVERTGNWTCVSSPATRLSRTSSELDMQV
jgi:hypothetical protein